jgi:hypothetical protein
MGGLGFAVDKAAPDCVPSEASAAVALFAAFAPCYVQR